MDELQPFFESRETRTNRLPEDVRGRFMTAALTARDSGDTEFEDRQFSALWLSQRTGIPRKQVLDNFNGIASRFFGPGVTASGAYDAIAGQYKGTGGGTGEDKGEAGKAPRNAQDGAEWAPVQGFAKPGVQVLMENVEQAGRAFAGGFEQFAQRVPAGLYSQAAAAMGFRMKVLGEDAEFKGLAAKNAELDSAILETDNPFQLPKNTLTPAMFGMSRMSDEQARMLFDPAAQPEREKTVADNRAKMAAIAGKVDRENLEGLKAWRESTRGQLSQEYRRLADFWYGLSEGAVNRMGVSEDFAQSAFGQFMQSAGSVPATIALAAMGPGGIVGLESSFFADVESERMRTEGEAYDPVKALPANLASALPQMAMERMFGVERLMNNILAELPKQAGRVTFGDFAKQFVRRGLTAGVEEGITEPAQGFWNDYVASLTYDEKRETLTGDAAKRRLIESVSGFTLGALFGGGITAVEAVDRNRQVGKGADYLTTKTGEPLAGPDFAVMREVKTDEEIAASAPDAETGRILLAAVNGDQAAQAEYNKRTLEAKFVKTEGMEMRGMALGVVEDVPVIRMTDGVIVPLDMTEEEDRTFVDNFKKEVVRQTALNETADFLSNALEAGRTLEISEEQRTLQDFINESKLEVEDAVQRIGIARDVNAIALPSDANPEDVKVLGSNVSEYSAGVYRDVSKVYAGGTAFTAVEEVAEGYVKKRLAVGDLNEAELQTWRESYERETGEKTTTTGTISNIEWFSKRAVDYAVANRKMDGMPKSWGAFLRTLGEHLKTVLRLSQKLVKLKRDGKLDANFEGNLKAALGMAPVPKASAVKQVPQQGQPGGLMSTFSMEPTVDQQISFATTGLPQTQLQALQAQAQRIRSKKLMATGQLIARIQAGQSIPARVRNVRRTAQASLAAKLLVPISTRLKALSPSLAVRLRRFEFDSAQALSRDYSRVLPFAQAMEKMRDSDAAILDLALKNGDTDARDAVLAAYNAQGAFAEVLAVIEEVKQRAVAAGYEVGTVENYFPRKVADLDGLMVHYYGKPQAGHIERALTEAAEKAIAQGRILTQEERMEVVNTALRGYGAKESKPGNLKTRKTEVVGVDANPFYTDSVTALSYYLDQMNAAVEKRRFFGKYSVAVPGVPGANTSRLNLEASIGGFVEGLIATGELDRKGQAELQAILEGRFNQQASSEFIKNFKALSYMATMGHITSGLTQITDLAFSLYENGVYDTVISGAQAVARKSQVSRKDLGLESPAEEFRDMGKMNKAVDRVFKLVGIHYLDLIGKETLTNAKLRQMQRQAASGKLSKRSAGIISTVFGQQQGAQVIADLAAGRVTDDVKFAIYNVLADYQPISLSEYPEYYLRHPNGRVFYMLKTFTIKQVDAFRREAITQMVRGNAKQKVEGFRNLIHLAGLLFVVGVPVDWLKDWIMARDPQLSDIAVDNLFKLVGVNRWSLWQFRENPDPVRAALLLAAPPAPFITYPFMDVKQSAEAISEGEDIVPGNFESWRMLPFVGSPLYWYLGGGKEKTEARMKKRSKEAQSGNSRIKR